MPVFKRYVLFGDSSAREPPPSSEARDHPADRQSWHHRRQFARHLRRPGSCRVACDRQDERRAGAGRRGCHGGHVHHVLEQGAWALLRGEKIYCGLQYCKSHFEALSRCGGRSNYSLVNRRRYSFKCLLQQCLYKFKPFTECCQHFFY